MHRANVTAVLVAALVCSISFAAAEEIQFLDEAPADCSSLPGTVAITKETRATARAAGVPDTSPCWKPNDPYMSASAGEAKLYLRSIVCPNSRDNYGGAGPDETITKLNPNFAVCAAKFLKAASAQMSVCINEGYRTAEKQREYYERYQKGTGGIACDPSKKNCEHPRGMAIDVNTPRESDYPRLWRMAPQFGLSFNMGYQDKYHMAPANYDCVSTLNDQLSPGSTGVSVPTSLPVSVYDFPQYAPSANPFQDPNLAFMLPVLQQLARAPQSAPPSPVITPSQYLPQQPQILPNTPTPQTPSPTTPTPQTPTPHTPTLPTTPIPTSTPATSTPSQPTATPVKSTQPSWIDIILGYAGYDSGATATSAPAQLNGGLSGSSDISPVSGAPASSSQQTVSNVPFVPRPTQTFTSGDLANNPSPAISREEISRLSLALAQLRSGLERFLGITAEPRAIQNAARWFPQ